MLSFELATNVIQSNHFENVFCYPIFRSRISVPSLSILDGHYLFLWICYVLRFHVTEYFQVLWFWRYKNMSVCGKISPSSWRILTLWRKMSRDVSKVPYWSNFSLQYNYIPDCGLSLLYLYSRSKRSFIMHGTLDLVQFMFDIVQQRALIPRLQKIMQTFISYCNIWRVTVNADKNQGYLFKRTPQSTFSRNSPVRISSTHVFPQLRCLGFTLYSTLTWRHTWK